MMAIVGTVKTSGNFQSYGPWPNSSDNNFNSIVNGVCP